MKSKFMLEIQLCMTNKSGTELPIQNPNSKPDSSSSLLVSAEYPQHLVGQLV